MTDAIRDALESARESMTCGYESTSALAKIDAALAALDAETPATPADVGEEPDVEALEPPVMMQLRQDNGNPAWMQIEALFNRNNCEVPGWRVRDELVSFFVWAQYGKKAATALERVVRERDAALRNAALRMARLEEALKPIISYVKARHRSPLKGIGDSVHMIHGGTEFEAELRFSDLEALARALSQEGSEPS